MKHAQIEAIYYHGQGLPIARATRCEQDPHARTQLLREVGFHRRTFRDTDPEQEMRATPLQNATGRRLSQTIEFGNGCATVTTLYHPAPGPDDVEKTPLKIDLQIVDEYAPVALLNPYAWKDAEGKEETFVLAELTYQEVDDDDHHDTQEAPAPSIPPARQLVHA